MLSTFRSAAVCVCLFLLYSYCIADGFDCEVIKYTTYCEISNEKLTVTDSVVLQINNRTGEKYTNIKISFSKDNPVSDLSAWIEDKNGRIIRYLKKSEITDANIISDVSFYTDNFYKRFVLKYSDYPYRIGYTYRQSSKQFLNIAFWNPFIGAELPTHKAQLTLIHPQDYLVNISENLMPAPVVSINKGVKTTTWCTTYDGSYKNEVFGADADSYIPGVKIVPVHFQYGVPGEASSWKSFGNWQFRLNKDLDVLPETEKQNIAALINGISNKKEIIRILYHYMQDHTRYISVAIDIGGLKPYPATYVSQNRYGDCKALTIYMKALLKSAGIESFYTLVNACSRPPELITSFPSQQFNHVILAVPVEDDTLWLENTNNSNPFGYTGTFTQNRKGLLIDEQESHLVNIPALKVSDVTESRRIDFRIGADGRAETSLRFVFFGHAYEVFNSLITGYSSDAQNKYVHEFLPFPAFELQEWKIVKKGRDARYLSFEASLTVSNIVHALGDEYYIAIQPAMIPDFELPADRKLPVQLAYPVYRTDTLNYYLPENKKLQSLPQRVELESKFGKYSLDFRQEDGTLTILRDFQLFPGIISKDLYPGFYDFISAIKSKEKLKIIFQ